MNRLPLILLLCVFSITLPAQSAPPVEGELEASGVLEHAGRISGHFRLTDNSTDEGEYAYTITLLSTDLQPLGSKVYESTINLEFEAIVFNGEHLGVLLKEGSLANRRYFDILDGRGELVRRVELKAGNGTAGLFVHPIAGAFVAAIGVQGNFYGTYPRIRFFLTKISAVGEEEDWERSFTGEKKKQSALPNFLDGNEEHLVFSVTRINQLADPNKYEDLYNIDPRTGEDHYRFFQEEKKKAYNFPTLLQGELVGDELLTVRHKHEKTEPKGVGITLTRYDATGKKTLTRTIGTEAMLREEVKKSGLATFSKRLTVVPSLLQAGASGEITIGFETYVDPPGKAERRYGPAYVMGLGADFQPVAVVEVPKTEFAIDNRDLKSLNGFAIAGIGRKLRKGKSEDLSLKQLLSLHGGPYSYALTYAGRDYISGYFIDRTFADSGVTYHAIHAVTFLDGEFIRERIPLDNAPDFVSLGRAKEGYLKVTEYKMGEGITDIRLERLSY